MRTKLRPVNRVVAVVLALVWACASVAGFAIAHTPRTTLGWVAFALILPVAYLAATFFGEALLTFVRRLPGLSHARIYVERKSTGQSLSLLRIGYLLGEFLLFAALVGAVVWVANALLSPAS